MSSEHDSGLNLSVHNHNHCVKSVGIRSFSGPYLPAFGLNTERYKVSVHIQAECWKIWTRKCLNTDSFHAVKFYLKKFSYNQLFCQNKFKFPTNYLFLRNSFKQIEITRVIFSIFDLYLRKRMSAISCLKLLAKNLVDKIVLAKDLVALYEMHN